MKLYSYKLTHDTGFAPNPFWGLLTLATCRPGMRRNRQMKEGDWVAGFTSVELNEDAVGAERLIYLMQIAEKITIADYYHDPRFRTKIPNPHADRAIERCGDNIYRPLRKHAVEPAHFKQLPNPNHMEGVKACGRRKPASGFHVNDIGGKNVLIASDFIYFGQDAIEIPASLCPYLSKRPPPCGNKISGACAKLFIDFVFSQAKGKRVIGPPHSWPEDDDSWREG